MSKPSDQALALMEKIKALKKVVKMPISIPGGVAAKKEAVKAIMKLPLPTPGIKAYVPLIKSVKEGKTGWEVQAPKVTVSPVLKPSPLDPLEIISPAYMMYKRSLSPIGAIKTILSPQEEQVQRLTDFGGAIGAITPEGKITEFGKTIGEAGEMIKSVTTPFEFMKDWKKWLLIGGVSLGGLYLLGKVLGKRGR